jgi:hypothetical protein
LGDLPVGAVGAVKVTAPGSEGVGKRTRVKMEEGLFFEPIKVLADRISENETVEGSLLIFAHLTLPPSSWLYQAIVGAELTENSFLGLFLVK